MSLRITIWVEKKYPAVEVFQMTYICLRVSGQERVWWRKSQLVFTDGMLVRSPVIHLGKRMCRYVDTCYKTWASRHYLRWNHWCCLCVYLRFSSFCLTSSYYIKLVDIQMKIKLIDHTSLVFISPIAAAYSVYVFTLQGHSIWSYWILTHLYEYLQFPW